MYILGCFLRLLYRLKNSSYNSFGNEKLFHILGMAIPC